jgi:hypothetical protein
MVLANRRSYVLPLNLPLPGGDVLRYATAEVLEARGSGGAARLVVTGAPGAPAEVELVTAAKGASLDGRRIRVRRTGRRLRACFTTTGGPQTLLLR